MVVLPDTNDHYPGIRGTWNGVSFSTLLAGCWRVPTTGTKLHLLHLVALDRPGHRDP